MYTHKRLKTVVLAIKQGGVTSRDLLKFYNSRRSTFRVLNDLTGSGLLKKTEAPENIENATYVWTPTEKLKEIMKVNNKNKKN